MSDVFDPEDYGLEARNVSIPRPQVRKWEQDSKRLKELEAQMENLQRDQVFASAGVPNEGAGAIFRKGYDGPMEVDAIRAAAQPFLGQTGAVNASLQGHEAARNMAAGASTANTSGGLAELARLKAKSRNIKNTAEFEADKAEIDRILSEAGVTGGGIFDSMSGWQLPGQMAGT